MPASLKHKSCESHKPYTHKAEPQPRDQNAQKTSALKQIHGSQLTLEDLLNPIEEDEVGTMGYEFPHGNNDIIAQVLQEQGRDEVDEDEDSNGDEKQRKLCGLKTHWIFVSAWSSSVLNMQIWTSQYLTYKLKSASLEVIFSGWSIYFINNPLLISIGASQMLLQVSNYLLSTLSTHNIQNLTLYKSL